MFGKKLLRSTVEPDRVDLGVSGEERAQFSGVAKNMIGAGMIGTKAN
jgi:hypothetical protein